MRNACFASLKAIKSPRSGYNLPEMQCSTWTATRISLSGHPTWHFFDPIRVHLRLPIQHLQCLRRSGFWLDPPPLMRDIRPISMDKPLAGQPWYNLSGLYAWALDLDPSPPNQLPSIPAKCLRKSCRACTKMQTSNQSIGRGCLESLASKPKPIHASASVVPDVDASCTVREPHWLHASVFW